MSIPLFVYGSMLDPDVRSIILGDSTQQVTLVTANLPDHVCLKLPDESYPVLSAESGCVTHGAILLGLDENSWDRMNFFESDEFKLVEISVLSQGRISPALCYGAGAIMQGAKQPWTLEHWQANHKEVFLGMIKPYMALYGKADLEAAEALWQELQQKME